MGLKSDFIAGMEELSLIDLHNAHCEHGHDTESVIYPNNEENFNALIGDSVSPWDVIDMLADSYTKNDEYIQYGVHGIDSCNSPLDLWIFPCDLVREDLSEWADDDDCINHIATELEWDDSTKEVFTEWLDDNGYYITEEEDWDSLVDDFNDSNKEEE